jgi:hypothetical protein
MGEALMATSFDLDDAARRIDREGFTLALSVYNQDEVDQLGENLDAALCAAAGVGESIRGNGEAVYAARNLLDLFPAARECWRRPPLTDLLRSVLGTDYGLVRGLFFDKPPGRAWALPWHQDRTIAVADNSLPSRLFTRPTCKAGVPHVEAPPELLGRMLTLRIHLDDVTPDNGPLRVAPGTHRPAAPAVDPTFADGPSLAILAARGDVLAIRPLVAHCSGHPKPGHERRRRVLHLEFAGERNLPDGYSWRQFL